MKTHQSAVTAGLGVVACALLLMMLARMLLCCTVAVIAVAVVAEVVAAVAVECAVFVAGAVVLLRTAACRKAKCKPCTAIAVIMTSCITILSRTAGGAIAVAATVYNPHNSMERYTWSAFEHGSYLVSVHLGYKDTLRTAPAEQ